MTIKYIIGFRTSTINDRRYDNLLLTLQYLIYVKQIVDVDLQIVVVEQDFMSKLTLPTEIAKEINYIFIHNVGYYNRGWAFNIACNDDDDSYYFFADNDIVMNIKDLIIIFQQCFKYDAINPYAHIYDTSEEFVNNITDIVTIANETDYKMFPERQNTCFSGGIMGMKGSALKKIGGWDERFRGRGWEDYAFTAKLELFLYKIKTFPFNALHLWHPWEINTTKEINQALNIEYESYTYKNYVKLIENVSFGNPLKYSTNANANLNAYKIKIK